MFVSEHILLVSKQGQKMGVLEVEMSIILTLYPTVLTRLEVKEVNKTKITECCISLHLTYEV